MSFQTRLISSLEHELRNNNYYEIINPLFLYICFFFAHKKYSRSFITLGLNVVASASAVRNHSQGLGVFDARRETLFSLNNKAEKTAEQSPESFSVPSFIQFFL